MVWGSMSSDAGLTCLGQKASLPSAEEKHSPHKTTVAYSDCLMQYATLLSAPSSLSVTGHDTCICPIKFIRYWSCHFYLPHHHVYPFLVMPLLSVRPLSSLSVTAWSWHFYLSGHHQVYPFFFLYLLLVMTLVSAPSLIKFICYWSLHFYLPITNHVYPLLVMSS